jgi:hypothetical protein
MKPLGASTHRRTALPRELLERLASAVSPRARAAGFRYDGLPPEIVERAPEWLRAGDVPGGTALRPGRAYRYGDWLVKLYGPGHPLKDRFRRSAAVRSADWYAHLLPFRTPRPLLAAEVRERGRLRAAILVSEFIEGPSLTSLWGEPEERTRGALAAFARFLAEMHRRRIHHGDVHPANFLWDGTEWALIDLDGMRGRRTITRRIVERQWVRMLLVLRDEQRLRGLFGTYLDVARLDWEPAASWERIRAQAAAIRAKRSSRE